MASKPELLAPAGGFEQLEYAIRFGADAVYLASERFGMRARACNFPLSDIPRVVEYAHAHNVKVHVTCNIVMHEADIAALPAYFEALQAAGVDAVIVGDLGALRLARKYAPDVAVHVSTQASVSNAQAALVWHELGANRIVCAREMSLESIAAMKKQLPSELELEAFAHGAMCMAYSGRCLISDFTCGRSALEGNCAQSCRWSYELVEEKRPGEYYTVEQDDHGSYLLNAQDLNMLAHLDAMAAAGIDSIKIEGRNKKAYYVACVVNAYRQVLDGADPTDFASELEYVSHRPYSTGFFFGPAHQTHGSVDYVRTTEWAAQALSCEQLEDGSYRAEVRCRNRFALANRFEVLSPGKPVCALHMSSIEHIAASRAEILSANTKEGWAPDETEDTNTAVANHTNERYIITCDTALDEGDIIRVFR